MVDYQIKLEDISKKIGLLLSRYDELKVRNRVLEEEIRQLKDQKEDLLRKHKEINEEFNIVRISRQIDNVNPEDKQELKKKINEFIKEIDKCVALLNN